VAAAAAATAAATVAYANTLAAADAAPTIEVEHVTLSDGRVLAYRSMGDPDGVPIICLHGMSSCHLTWIPKSGSFASLAPGVRIIAIDRPGYGGSSNPPAWCARAASLAFRLSPLSPLSRLSRLSLASLASPSPLSTLPRLSSTCTCACSGRRLTTRCPITRSTAHRPPAFSFSPSPFPPLPLVVVVRSYSYAHFCRDLDELATALQLPHFCVAGHSSGGPYALAAAALLPERVLACAAVSSDPPYNHPRCPDTVRVSDSMASDQKGGFSGRDPVQKVSKWRAQVMDGDDAAKQWAWRPGVLGFVTDFTLERIPWSFKLEDVQLGERLTFWYGSKDYDPMIMGSPWMASLVPGSQLRVVEGGKHSFKSDPVHLSAILVELRDQARRAAQRERLDVAFTL
jgi:pimeloyl-ACP methyl ester carboxylesterase